MITVSGRYKGKPVTVRWADGLVTGPDRFLKALDKLAAQETVDLHPLIQVQFPNLRNPDEAGLLIESLFDSIDFSGFDLGDWQEDVSGPTELDSPSPSDENGGVRKHAAPIHPGTGSDQSVHAGSEKQPLTAEEPEWEPWDSQKYFRGVYGLPELEQEGAQWILTHNLADFEKNIDRLGRRAKKLGIEDPIRVEPLLDNGKAVTRSIVDKTGSITRKLIDEPNISKDFGVGRVYDFTAVQLIGQKPEIGGFQILARIEHSPEGRTDANLVHVAPGTEEGAVPKKYRTAAPDCDVCHRKVWRKNTYIVRNKDTGEIVQVGRDDLRIYTGQPDIENQAKWMDDYVRTMTGGREDPIWTPPKMADPVAVLAHASASIRQDGYHKSGSALSTKDVVAHAIFLQPQKMEPAAMSNARNVIEEDMRKAEDVLKWVRDPSFKTESDYMFNLKQILGRGAASVHIDKFGYAVSAVTAYDREMGFLEERKAKESRRRKEGDFIGTVGERRTFENLTVMDTKVGVNEYTGRSWRLTTLRDQGGNIVKSWYNGKATLIAPTVTAERVKEEAQYFGGDEREARNYLEQKNARGWQRGDILTFDAKVKEHETDEKYRKGEKITWIERITKFKYVGESGQAALEMFEKSLIVDPGASFRWQVIK